MSASLFFPNSLNVEIGEEVIVNLIYGSSEVFAREISWKYDGVEMLCKMECIQKESRLTVWD